MSSGSFGLAGAALTTGKNNVNPGRTAACALTYRGTTAVQPGDPEAFSQLQPMSVAPPVPP